MGNVVVGLFVIGVGVVLVSGPVLVKRGTIPRTWAGTGTPMSTLGFVMWSVLVVPLGLLAIVLGIGTLFD